MNFSTNKVMVGAGRQFDLNPHRAMLNRVVVGTQLILAQLSLKFEQLSRIALIYFLPIFFRQGKIIDNLYGLPDVAGAFFGIKGAI